MFCYYVVKILEQNLLVYHYVTDHRHDHKKSKQMTKKCSLLVYFNGNFNFANIDGQEDIKCWHRDDLNFTGNDEPSRLPYQKLKVINVCQN